MNTKIVQLREREQFLLKRIAENYATRGLKFGWPSNGLKSYDYGHWNRLFLSSSRHLPYDMSNTGTMNVYKDVKEIWNIIQEVLGPRALSRCYINGYTYGTEAYAHVDDADILKKYGPDCANETVIVYLNEKWDIDWAGETVIFDDSNEVESSILPKFGRMLIFDSTKLHCARPVTKICPVLRLVLVFKTIDKKIISKEVEFIASKTQDLPHSGKTFFEHLYNTAKILESYNCSKEVCAAGLYHSVYNTEYYKPNLGISREQVKELIGEYAEELVHTFCKLENRTYNLINNHSNLKGNFYRDLLLIEKANLFEQNQVKHAAELALIEEKLLENKQNNN